MPRSNLLTRALADDPHFGPYMAIPGKDNGFDIEGLAVDGRRLLLGLRGPVLRGWSALLEIAVEARGDDLRLVPLDDSGTLSASTSCSSTAWASAICTSPATTSTSWPARRWC